MLDRSSIDVDPIHVGALGSEEATSEEPIPTSDVQEHVSVMDDLAGEEASIVRVRMTRAGGEGEASDAMVEVVRRLSCKEPLASVDALVVPAKQGE
jgi:hypothetical protein